MYAQFMLHNYSAEGLGQQILTSVTDNGAYFSKAEDKKSEAMKEAAREAFFSESQALQK